MAFAHTRRNVLKSGAIVAAAGAMPAAATTSASPLRGPRLVYARTGFFTAVGGFPTLMAYDDGLVVYVSAPSKQYPTPARAEVGQVGPATIRRLLKDVTATGVFEARPIVLGGSGYDGDGEYIEATVGDRKVVRYAYMDTDEQAVPVYEAAKALRTFVEDLGRGKPYEPAGYLLELATPGLQGPDDPAPIRWPLETRAPLRPLLDGFQGRLVLPPSALPRLRTVGDAYTPLAVTSRGAAVRIVWRPLYPHE